MFDTMFDLIAQLEGKGFNPNQPRDVIGRFGSGGMGTVTANGGDSYTWRPAGGDHGFNDVPITAPSAELAAEAGKTLDGMPPVMSQTVSSVAPVNGPIDGDEGIGGVNRNGHVEVRVDKQAWNAGHVLTHEAGHSLDRQHHGKFGHEVDSALSQDLGSMGREDRRTFAYYTNRSEAIAESLAYHAGPNKGTAKEDGFASVFPRTHAAVGAALGTMTSGGKGFNAGQARDSQGRWTDGGALSAGEVNAVKDYVEGGMFDVVNDALRHGIDHGNPDFVSNMDSAMRPLSNDETAYRVVPVEVFQHAFGKLKPGDQVTDNAYVSTTKSESALADVKSALGIGQRSTTIEILVRKGHKSVDVNDAIGDKHDFAKQKEIILRRGTTFNVIKSTPERVILETADED